MEFNEENINKWIEANPRFATDEFNINLLSKYLQLAAKAGREIATIEAMSALINANSRDFHWLRDEAEISSAVAKAVAAQPKPEPPKQERLKGLTPAERLYHLGVPVSGVVRAGMAHSDREQNDRKQSSVLQAIAKEAATTRAEIERQEKIAEARSITIYSAGPNGRVNHAATADARRRALAALGLTE
jgi:hypothetical protein